MNKKVPLASLFLFFSLLFASLTSQADVTGYFRLSKNSITKLEILPSASACTQDQNGGLDYQRKPIENFSRSIRISTQYGEFIITVDGSSLGGRGPGCEGARRTAFVRMSETLNLLQQVNLGDIESESNAQGTSCSQLVLDILVESGKVEDWTAKNIFVSCP